MNDLQRYVRRQTAWQRSRADRPWAEKLRDSVTMRKSVLALRVGSGVGILRERAHGGQANGTNPRAPVTRC